MKQWVSLGLFDCEPSPKKYCQGPRWPPKPKRVTKSGCKLAWKQAFPDAGFVCLLYHYLCKNYFCTSDLSSDAAMLVHSLPSQSRKRWTHDVIYTSVTPCSRRHRHSQTYNSNSSAHRGRDASFLGRRSLNLIISCHHQHDKTTRDVQAKDRSFN